MNTRPTHLHTRNGGNVVEDGKALKRRWPRLLFYVVAYIVCSGALGALGAWALATVMQNFCQPFK